MKTTSIILLCFVLVFLLRMVLGIIFRPVRQVHDLLSKYPDADQTSVFLPSRPISWRIWREPQAVCAKIDEMRKQGWTYLRSSRVGRSVDIARRDIAIYSHEGLSYDHAD
jgi:hypothetical protein